MGLSGKDLARLGPAARRQIMQALHEPAGKRAGRTAAAAPVFDSELERAYYERFIFPFLMTGEIQKVETHKEFLLLPAGEYCGVKLPAAHYTVDFLVTYKSGTVEAVEVKHRTIRRLQRDYIYRRRLFIDLIARPQGWKFREYMQDQ